MKIIDCSKEAESKTSEFATFIMRLWDLSDDAEIQDAVHACLGFLGFAATIWNPYAIVGLMETNAYHIIKDLEDTFEEDVDE